MAQPQADVSALEVRRKVMVKDFTAQHQQHDTAFAVSMEAMEKKATLEHIQREADVAVVLQRITMQYDDAVAQRRARWTAAEQLMREASSVRENRRSETANVIEQGRQLTALNTLEDWTSAAQRGISQLEETAVGHLNELNARLAAILSSSSIKSSVSMGDTRDAGHSLRLPSRGLQNIFPLKSIQMPRPLQPVLRDKSDAPAGQVRYTKEEPPSVTEMAIKETGHRIPEQQPTHPPQEYDTTSFSKLSKQMEVAFTRAQTIRHDRYVAVQSQFDDMTTATVGRPFAAKRSRLNELFRDFVRRLTVVEAEEAQLLAAGGAVARFQAMEMSRNELYAQSGYSILSTLSKTMERVMRTAEIIEFRMLQAGVLRRTPLMYPPVPQAFPADWPLRIPLVPPPPPTPMGMHPPGMPPSGMPPPGFPGIPALPEEDYEAAPAPPLQSAPSKRIAAASVSGAAILVLIKEKFRNAGRHSRPIAPASSARPSAILYTEPQRFYAAQADRMTRFDGSQAAHLDDSAACEAGRKAIFDQLKERQCEEALKEESRRWFEFEDTLAEIRRKWQDREVARAETFEKTIEELGRLFRESQEKRSSQIQAAVNGADNACRAAVEKATRGLGAFIDAIAKNGFASIGSSEG